MKSEVNFFVGLLWGSLFSIILWMTFFEIGKGVMETIAF